ncbi:MAG: phage terminase small subunit P27 family [Dehalococcoidales bacterium]|nr:phage terminase small subunit P27 family [Dehalococcoidales bacterium]
MGGRGSGGHNKKSVEEHIKGFYRPSRHGPLPESLAVIKERYQKQRATKPAPGKAQGGKKAAGVAGAAVAVPACPEHLDEYGKAEWARVCQELQKKGLLENAFVSAIEGYCEAYSRWRRASKKIEKDFTYVFVEEMKSKRRVLPEVTIVKDALNQMKAFLNDLGLTPKNLVVMPPKDSRSEMDKFLDAQARKL